MWPLVNEVSNIGGESWQFSCLMFYFTWIYLSDYTLIGKQYFGTFRNTCSNRKPSSMPIASFYLEIVNRAAVIVSLETERESRISENVSCIFEVLRTFSIST